MTRREAAHGAKADKPKRYEPRHRLQHSRANRRTFAAAAADDKAAITCTPFARGACCSDALSASYLDKRSQHEQHRGDAYHSRAPTTARPSAQASCAVDFPPGVTPQVVKLHRACFEIWLYEGESQPIS